MSKITIKFQYSLSHRNIFYQPLFYLGENIKYALDIYSEKDLEDLIKSGRKDSNLEFDIGKYIATSSEINLEATPIHEDMQSSIMNSGESTDPTSSIKSSHIAYTLDRFITGNTYPFKYKSAKFVLEILEIMKEPINEGRCGYSLFSLYHIKFESKDLPVFEDFIKSALIYNNKFYNKIFNEGEKITMYISASEGGFFDFLGKRDKRSLESVYIPKKKKQDIINDLEKFLKPETKSRYSSLGINYKRTYLLEGLPGTGKTSLILALASQFNYNLAIVHFSPKLTDIDLVRMLRSLDDNHGDSSKKTMIVFEDIDCIFKERKSQDESRNMITFSGLLNALDGIATRDNMVTFITTNYKNNLDNALVRPGRIDYIMTFEAANREQITDMFKAFTGSDSKDQVAEFVKACGELNIPNLTTSLLQQYLMKYIDEPILAIENVDYIKKIYEASKVATEASETGLFS